MRLKRPPGQQRWRRTALEGWTSYLMFSCPQSSVYIISSPGSQVFRLRLNYTNSFPGSPACRLQIVGLFNLHYHMSQFLIINYIYDILVLFLWRNLTNRVTYRGREGTAKGNKDKARIFRIYLALCI